MAAVFTGVLGMYDASMFKIYTSSSGGRIFEVIPGRGGFTMGLTGFTREEFREDDLMLFPGVSFLTFWHMRGVLFDIDIHFLNGAGRLLKKASLRAESGRVFAAFRTRHVVETRRGWFKGKAGDKLIDYRSRTFYRQ